MNDRCEEKLRLLFEYRNAKASWLGQFAHGGVVSAANA